MDFEKLGAFYLGKRYELESDTVTDDLLLYDSKDLTTHAICVGMTGSGKTGLCLGLLEEALIDGIPAIVIDPKGDLGNLMLTFPELRPADFRPWVDDGEALRKGMDPDTYASKTAEMWRTGLASWGQNGARIRKLKNAAEATIYTPGSRAGMPLSVIKSFSAPSGNLADDPDAMRDRIQSAVSGLLALLGIDADPLQSREHILLASILSHAWDAGRDLELADLIREIQSPPLQKLGVFDLDSFYPAADRLALAMRLNNALASPGFSVWMEGEALDIQNLLYTKEGTPRLSILSIAHLSESERMFFVTMLLNEVVSWMRTQPGTTSLRALLYMDEIFGYFPPTANPPSKAPMLTLLKQARAYGLGCVLATQNPVDLDYKGLGNTGTWFIGRLQAERDKARLLDGLEGAAGSSGQNFDRSEMERILSSLKSRVFLMNNVHENAPVLFHTRWVMSYLRGPMTRTQIKTLMAPRIRAAARAPQTPVPATTMGVDVPKGVATTRVPARVPDEPDQPTQLIPPGIKQIFLAPKRPTQGQDRLVYRPALFVHARVHYARVSAKVDDWFNVGFLARVPDTDADVDFFEATVFEHKMPAFGRRRPSDGEFASPEEPATVPRNYASWSKDAKRFIYENRALEIRSCKALKALSTPEETEQDFAVRLRQLAAEKRDLEMEKIKKRHAPKLASLEERIRKADARVEREEQELKQHGFRTALAVGSTILGAMLGRKAASLGTMRRAGTAMSRAGRTSSQKGDIARAKESAEALRQRLEDLEANFQADLTKLKDSYAIEDLDIATIVIRPRKTDLNVKVAALAWTPWAVSTDGIAEPLF